MKLTPLGDSAITISFSKPDSAGTHDLLPTVWAAREAIEKAAIPGVVEAVSSYESVTVFVDPLVPLSQGISPDAVSKWFNDRIGNVTAAFEKKRPRSKQTREREIPVCFENEFALDLADVSERCGLAPETVIARFCEVTYQVACVGFTPGFPYLAGLPPELATPRKSAPRVAIPAGSVAIGGSQAGIYPFRSPGGWNLLGRTPLRLFDPTKAPPSLLNAGDRIHFKRIDRSEFETQHDLLWP